MLKSKINFINLIFIFYFNLFWIRVLNLASLSNIRLKKMKGLHSGKRFYIFGSGASLKSVNFSELEDCPAIFLHGAHTASSLLDSSFKYWVFTSEARLRESKKKSRAEFSCTFVCPGTLTGFLWPFWKVRILDILCPIYKENNLIFDVQTRRPFFSSLLSFSKQDSQLVDAPNGAASVFIGMQLADYLGASEIVLFGCDFGRSSPSGDYYFSPKISEPSNVAGGKDHFDDVYDDTTRPALLWYKSFYERNNITLTNLSTYTRDDVLNKS